MMDPAKAPPKDIANAIHGACFDYIELDTHLNLTHTTTVERRIYDCWQNIIRVMRNMTPEQINFIIQQTKRL